MIPGLNRREKKTRADKLKKRTHFVQQVKSRLKYLENEGAKLVIDKERLGLLKSAAEKGERILLRRARIKDVYGFVLRKFGHGIWEYAQ